MDIDVFADNVVHISKRESAIVFGPFRIGEYFSVEGGPKLFKFRIVSIYL